MTDCTHSNYTFIDPSTQKCVTMCPEVPDLYGYDNNTCMRQCPVGTFAENFTRTCV